MMWSDLFIGMPYEKLGRSRGGCDCWGLACIVYREELAISLPDYLGQDVPLAEQDEIAALIDGGAASPLWVPVTGPALAFDLALFRRGRWTSHIGIVVRHGLMLHMADRRASILEGYNRAPWNTRLTGVYRHVDVISAGARA